MTNLQTLQLRRNDSQNGKSSFFACLSCLPDEDEVILSSRSSTSRKDLKRPNMNAGPSAMERSKGTHRASPQTIHLSKRSSTYQDGKVSMKNRKTINIPGRENIQGQQTQNWPNFLPAPDNTNLIIRRQPQKARTFQPNYRCFNDEAFYNRYSTATSTINSEVTRQSRPPTVAFTYMKVQEKQQAKVPRQTERCQQKQQPPQTNSMKSFSPRLVISNNLEESRQPLRQTEFINCIPEEPAKVINLELKVRLRDLYKEQSKESYESGFESLKLSCPESADSIRFSNPGKVEPLRMTKGNNTAFLRMTNGNSTDSLRMTNGNSTDSLRMTNQNNMDSLRMSQKTSGTSDTNIKSSNSGRFGKGKLGFKVRQAVSIKDQEDQQMCDSVVLAREPNNGLLRGLLNPISEVDEVAVGNSGIGTLFFNKLREEHS